MNSNEILRLNALKVAENWYQLITDLHTHMMCACVDVSVLCLRHTSECRTLYVYGCEGLIGLSCVYVALHACDPVVRMGMAACLITSVWVRLPMNVGVFSWLSSLLLFFLVSLENVCGYEVGGGGKENKRTTTYKKQSSCNDRHRYGIW